MLVMSSREMLQDFYANFARNFENLKYAIDSLERTMRLHSCVRRKNVLSIRNKICMCLDK